MSDYHPIKLAPKAFTSTYCQMIRILLIGFNLWRYHGFELMPVQNRLQLITGLDEQIARLESWQRLDLSPSCKQKLAETLLAIRLRRFQIWNSFFSRFRGAIQPAS